MSFWSFVRSLLSAERNAGAMSARKGRRIWVLGPMPPPLNGQSNYNKVITTFLRSKAEVIVLSTGATSAEKIAAGLILPLIILFRVRSEDRVYSSPPGQRGVWLFMLSLAALRLRGLEHFLHHHSFRPINLGPMRAMRFAVAIGGRLQRHVFLSEGMRDRFADIYLSPELKARSFVLPNAFFFFENHRPLPIRQGPVTIGHLSVITREKGVDYLMSVVERLLERRSDFRFVIAGPIRDAALRGEIDAFCARHEGRVSAIGPVYDAAKAEFYQDLDVFVLPSRLVDEADPLVILEAYSFGSEIVASATGCIPERIRHPSRLMSFAVDADSRLLDKTIDEIMADRAGTAEACARHVAEMHEQSERQAEAFFAALGIRWTDVSAGSVTPVPGNVLRGVVR